MRRRIRMIVVILATLMVIMACSFSNTSSSNTSSEDLVGTQAALALTQTAMSNVVIPPTVEPTQQQDEPVQPPTATEKPPATQDIQALMDSANILVYEDVAGKASFVPYVSRALKSVGGHHEYVADAMGTFMDKMESGTDWDLIIVAAELHERISGDYWTEIKDQVDDGAALVAEVWYLDDIGAGKVGPLLSECGVQVQADWGRSSGDRAIDYGMYWIEPDSPVFNTPNTVAPFKSALTNYWWTGDIGDFLHVSDYSKAQILASHNQGDDTNYGLITTCLNGRVIFQTFCSHDYPTNDMIALWENYIKYTLKNHFLSMQ